MDDARYKWGSAEIFSRFESRLNESGELSSENQGWGPVHQMLAEKRRKKLERRAKKAANGSRRVA